MSLSIATTEFGPKKLYANLHEAAETNDKELYAVVWNRLDQTKAPALDWHGGNHLLMWVKCWCSKTMQQPFPSYHRTLYLRVLYRLWLGTGSKVEANPSYVHGHWFHAESL